MRASARRKGMRLAALALMAVALIVAVSSPAVASSQGTADCGPTISAVFLLFPSDPVPGEAWAVEPCNATIGARWLLMLGLAAVGAVLLWLSREQPARYVPLPPLGGGSDPADRQDN